MTNWLYQEDSYKEDRNYKSQPPTPMNWKAKLTVALCFAFLVFIWHFLLKGL